MAAAVAGPTAIPIFPAARRSAASAPARAARTAPAFRGATRCRPGPCSVEAVSTPCARAPRAAAVARSRTRPAPPPGSTPPTITKTGPGDPRTSGDSICGKRTGSLSYAAPGRLASALLHTPGGRDSVGRVCRVIVPTHRADSVRQVLALRAHRPWWDGRGLQGAHPGTGRVRADVRAQADPA